MIRAWYIGECTLRVPLQQADKMASKIAQKRANEAIDTLLQVCRFPTLPCMSMR